MSETAATGTGGDSDDRHCINGGDNNSSGAKGEVCGDIMTVGNGNGGIIMAMMMSMTWTQIIVGIFDDI